MNIDIDNYLKRIKYHKTLTCDRRTLRGIHRAQRFNIPFDMLDFHLKIAPNLDPDYIYKKLVMTQRGGGCSQLNELLALVLIELGYKVERLLARVPADTAPGKTPQLSHKILRVSFDNESWLCDVGFGGNCLIEPIPFVENEENMQSSGIFSLLQDDTWGYKLHCLRGKETKTVYTFHTTEYYPEDFNAINFYNTFSRKVGFCRHAIVTLPTHNGRKSLKDRVLYKTEKGKLIQEVAIKNARDYHKILEKEFNIILPNHSDFFPNKS
tara:strand:+ start:113684 stop:114484 length:801 start_codon:yes stop_codon:yes gene_type:complete